MRDILAKEQRVFTIIKKELREIRDKYGSPRLTEIAPDEAEINIEDLIVNEGCIISITHAGFIKRTAVSAFRAQRRGGKGVIGMQTREGATEEEEGDFVEHLFAATTHDYLMFFTAGGRAYVEKVYEIPEMGRAAKGRSIANILELKPDEKIAATIRVQSKKSGTGPSAVDQTWDENLHIVFATQSGHRQKIEPIGLRERPPRRHHRHSNRRRRSLDRRETNEWQQRGRVHYQEGNELAFP